MPTVLVIDDNPNFADTFAMVLNASGFQATSEYSGEQGIKRAREDSFDHLITDVMMPGTNGIEIATASREILPDCRILLISGNNNTTELLALAKAQGHDFTIVAKPVHPTSDRAN